MRLFVITCVLLGLSAKAYSAKRPGRAGLGIMLGEPTGLSGKLFLNDQNAIDAGLSFSFVDERLRAHGDYLLHLKGNEVWSPYIGVGGQIYIKSSDSDKDDKKNDGLLAIRVPVGIAYHWHTHPIDAFFEIGFGMGIVPETRTLIGGAIGARYYF